MNKYQYFSILGLLIFFTLFSIFVGCVSFICKSEYVQNYISEHDSLETNSLYLNDSLMYAPSQFEMLPKYEVDSIKKDTINRNLKTIKEKTPVKINDSIFRYKQTIYNNDTIFKSEGLNDSI